MCVLCGGKIGLSWGRAFWWNPVPWHWPPDSGSVGRGPLVALDARAAAMFRALLPLGAERFARLWPSTDPMRPRVDFDVIARSACR